MTGVGGALWICLILNSGSLETLYLTAALAILFLLVAIAATRIESEGANSVELTAEQIESLKP